MIKARVTRAFCLSRQIGLVPSLFLMSGPDRGCALLMNNTPTQTLQVIGAKATRNGEGKVTLGLED